MPTIEQQYNAAYEQLRLFAQPDAEPTLSPDELRTILTAQKRADVWTASTSYVVGDAILPTVGNGHRYICTQAGTSGATEPVWSKAMGAIASDGTSDPVLRWKEDGPAFKNVYNVRAAIHQAWIVKAGKASVAVDVNQQVGGLKASQIYDHCMKMAKSFAPMEIS